MRKSPIHLLIKEGLAHNYFEALEATFGGERTETTYKINKPGIAIDMRSYELFEDIQLISVEGKLDRPVNINRKPDNDPDFIHITIFNKGQVSHSYQQQQQLIEAQTSIGAFINNGIFPMQAEIPAEMHYRSIALKFKKSALIRLVPEAEDFYNKIFGDVKPIAYHMHLPIEVERLSDDVFYFKNINFGSRAMVKSRGLELFIALFNAARNKVAKNELKGLHYDDYHRLIKVKEKLISSFNLKIKVQDLADEFGVSASKLKRDFKSLYKCSIYQFYTHAKMDEAYRLLRTGKYSVMEVGYDLGYANLSKFAEMFKKVKGISPKEVIKTSN